MAILLLNNINWNHQTITFLDYANRYSNVSNAITAMAAIIAIYVSLRAIRISTKDSRKQILAHKIEEIYELGEVLGLNYGRLYKVYTILENSEREGVEIKGRQNLLKHFYESNIELKTKVDIEDLLKKTMRLNILANTYLNGNIKYDVIGYSQLFIAIIYILKYEDLKLREPEFTEPLPKPNDLFNFSDDINNELVKVIGYGAINKGYIKYRNTIFKEKLYPKKQ